MKKIFILMFLFFIVGANAQDTSLISLYLNLGQSVPIGMYRASPNSSNPIEIARTNPFACSFTCGMDVFVLKRLGISAGISLVSFELDNTTFEKVHLDNPLYTDSYIDGGNHTIGRFYTGITSRFSIHKLTIQPRLNIGITGFSPEFAEYYQKNSAGEIFKTINYNYRVLGFASYNGGLSADYELLNYRGIKLGIQFLSEFSYQNPTISYKKLESNKTEGTLQLTEHNYNQKLSYVYYGFGLIIKVPHTLL